MKKVKGKKDIWAWVIGLIDYVIAWLIQDIVAWAYKEVEHEHEESRR